MRKVKINKKGNLTKIYIFAAIFVVLMTVGYAILATTLTINGTITTNTSWNVYIYSVTKTTNTVGATELSAPTFNATSATFNVNLTRPGDSIEYDIVIKNGGNVKAALNSITANIAQSNTGLTYSYSGVSQGSVLNANNATHTVHLVFSWNSSDTSVPETTSKVLQLDFNYIQYSS